MVTFPVIPTTSPITTLCSSTIERTLFGDHTVQDNRHGQEPEGKKGKTVGASAENTKKKETDRADEEVEEDKEKSKNEKKNQKVSHSLHLS